MKILARFERSRVSLILGRGNMFQDRALEAVLLGGQMFLKNARRWFNLKVAEMPFPGLSLKLYCFYTSRCVSRETVGQWLFQSSSNLGKIAFGPVYIEDVLVLSGSAMDSMYPEPVLLKIGGRSVFLASEGYCGCGPRNEIKDSFLRFMKMASENGLSPAGCVSFGYNWLDADAVLGMCDAFLAFQSPDDFEVRIFEVNRRMEPHNLSRIQATLEKSEL